jgi:GxxExxY protein
VLICGEKKGDSNSPRITQIITDEINPCESVKICGAKKMKADLQEINNITHDIIGCAYDVHSKLGPGLLESTYEVCLTYELMNKGYSVETQKALPVIYEEIKLDAGYRIDMLVNNQVIVEIKSVESIADIHKAQILTYLKLSGKKVGLIINFNTPNLQNGIQRFIL